MNLPKEPSVPVVISFVGAGATILFLILLLIACFATRTPPWQAGSLYDAPFYYLKADGKVYTIIIDRQGNHHLTERSTDQ